MAAHPITEALDFSDDRAMAAYWGTEAVRAIRRAVAQPAPQTIWDHDLDHAVRATKMAWWHALKIGGRRWRLT